MAVVSVVSADSVVVASKTLVVSEDSVATGFEVQEISCSESMPHVKSAVNLMNFFISLIPPGSEPLYLTGFDSIIYCNDNKIKYQ